MERIASRSGGRGIGAVRRLASGVVSLLATLLATSASAQGPVLGVRGQAVLMGTSMRPVAGGERASELYLTQPTLIGTLDWRGLWGRLALNAEAATLDQGELTPGAWGEGFVDRRHPHTVIHELIAGATLKGTCGGLRCGVAAFAGKGFAPFGSDDPMSRPFLAYPVNHHLAQILERALVGTQLAVGPALLESALMNGDEPERPWQWPNLSRWGDSWAARLTLAPANGVELSASRAHVASPEARGGTGPDQGKWHVGARWEGTVGSVSVSGLAEWARTTEVDGFFEFQSRLAELSAQRGRVRLAYRLERTDRPEEERLTEFRVVRPHHDNALLGISRWTLHTLHAGGRLDWADVALEPFIEGTVGHVREIAGGLFDVTATYGGSRVNRVSAGVRVAWRMGHHRMGRYALAAAH